jgi:hypothetical protein
MEQTSIEWFLRELIKNNMISLSKEQAEENILGNLFIKAKEMDEEQRGYTKEDVLKAGEIGEINHHDYKHIASLLDEAKEINKIHKEEKK